MAVRWNSTFKILKTFIHLRKPLDAVMLNDDRLQKFVLSDSEWALVEAMTKFLKPFSKMSDKMSAKGLPSLSLVALVYVKLYRHLASYKVSSADHDGMKKAAESAKSKLDEYYLKSDALVYVVGLILDPRCKLKRCGLVGYGHLVRSYRKLIFDLWKKSYKSLPQDEGEDDGMDDLYEVKMKRAKFEHKDELDIYLSELPVKPADLRHIGVLGWWKNQESNIPNLVKMARDFLGACGTGVPLESTFSMGTDLLTSKRHRLSSESIRACLSLKSWWKCNTKEELLARENHEVLQKMQGELETNQG